MEQRQRPNRNPIITTRRRGRGKTPRGPRERCGDSNGGILWNNIASAFSGPTLSEINMMKLRFFAFLLSAALLGGAALAHGDKKHVVGTVEKVSADSVTVKIADGTSVEVKLV